MTQLSRTQTKTLMNKVESCLVLAEQKFSDFDRSNINLTTTINLRGRTGGTFGWRRFDPKNVTLKFHSVFYSENESHYLSQTVTHEVAHLIVWAMYHRNGVNVKPHGREWQRVMLALGVQPDTRHDYSCENLTTKTGNTVPYTCGCEDRIHDIGVIRHANIIKHNKKFTCRSCHQRIVAVSVETQNTAKEILGYDIFGDDDAAFQEAVQNAKPANLPPGPIPVPGRDKSWSPKNRRAAAKKVMKAVTKKPVKGTKFEMAMAIYTRCIALGQLRNETITNMALDMNTNFKNASTYFSRCAKV